MTLAAHAPPTFWDELSPLPDVLLVAAKIGTVLFAVAAVVETVRLIRGRRGAGAPALRGRLARLVSFLVLAGAVWPIAARIGDAEILRRQAAPLAMIVLWTLLALPALRLSAPAGWVRWTRWGSLAAADAAFGAALALAATHTHAPLNFPLFLAFAAAAHLAVALGWFARGAVAAGWRFFAWAAVLFFTADFFLPYAALAEQRAPATRVAHTVLARPDLRQAFFTAAGDAALVRTAAGELLRVNLADGRASALLPPTQPPVRLLAMDPGRTTFVTAFDAGVRRPLQRFLADTAALRDAYEGALPFAPAALLSGRGWLIVAGGGRGANALLCNDGYFGGGASRPLGDSCRELFLPVARVGRMLAEPSHGTVYVTEGDRWLARGSRLLALDANAGAIRHWSTVGAGVGDLAFDARREILFVGRPGRGLLEERTYDTLTWFGALSGPPGDDLLALDGKRNLLLAASRGSGYLSIYDLTTGKRVALTPVGEGLASLDYHEASGAALLCLDRGLVVVRATELPDLLDR
jgi:hypothetical protein